MASFLPRTWAATLGLALLIAACGTSHAASPHRHPGGIVPAKVPAGWSVSYPITLPSSYGTPTGLAVDPRTGDVWFFTQGRDVRLFRWSSSRKKVAESFRIPSNMWAGEFTPIAVDRSHRAWLGINQTVLIATPRRPGLQQIRLPAVKVGAPGSGLPHVPTPNFGAHATIDALVLGPRATIVTSRAFATELQTIDISSRKIGTIPLPAHTAISGLGARDLGAGGRVLAAALYSSDRTSRFGQFVHGGWTMSKTCYPESVTVAFGTIAVGGGTCIAAGRAGRSGPAAVKRVRIAGLPEKSAVAIVSGRTMVATARRGLVPVTDGRQGKLIPLGRVAAGPVIGGDSGQDPDRLVPVRPLLMQSGRPGKLYFVPANNHVIGLLRHRS